MPELVIKNARLVLPEGIVTGEMSIENGKIKEISIEHVEKGEREIDAENRLVIPGIFDTEVHVLTKSRRRGSLIRRETEAAAAAGVTTILVAPEPFKISNSSEAKSIIKCLHRNSIVDFCLQAGPIDKGSIDNILEISKVGIRFFKISTSGPYVISNLDILKVMESAKNLGLILCVRAESESVIREKIREAKTCFEARPPLAEEKAVEEILEKTKQTGATVHFERLSIQKSCQLLSKAGEEHLPVSGGACVFHLIFNMEDFERNHLLKLHPPLRSAEDVDSLWKAISTGLIDTVSSGHFPVSLEEMKGLAPIEAPAGLPGIELLLPTMFEFGIKKGRLTIELLVKVLSTRPAQIFGCYPRKGVLREGSDADFVILDTSTRKVTAEGLFQYADWTPYENMQLSGFPLLTVSRGEIVYENGEVIGKPGRGVFLSNR